MPRNFLIIYAAREGSSAIVARLSRNPHVLVPVFEELDRYWMQKFYADRDLVETIDRVYATGRLDLPNKFGARKYLAAAEDAQPRAHCAVGFKWRPHGVDRKLLDCLCRHEVLVLHLVRRDFAELICSLFISGQEVDGKRIGHAQFKAARSEEARARLSEDLDALTVPAAFRPVARLALRRLGRAVLQRLFLTRVRARGLQTRIIHYEDFNADPDGFFADLCAMLEVPAAVSDKDGPRRELRKVAQRPAKERVTGLDRWPLRPVMALSGRIYARLVAG